MTSEQAAAKIKEVACGEGCKPSICNDSCLKDKEGCAFALAIQALEEVEKYRKIGTPEECRENAIVADYVSERFPEILDTLEYARYRIGLSFKELFDGFKEDILDPIAQGLKKLFASPREEDDNGKAE